MIPVLGVPFVNRPDLFLNMINSIDVEVGEVVIIDNSQEGILQNLAGPTKMRVVSMRHNVGVSASWNSIIKLTPLSPWWAIVNSDLEFNPGELQKLIDTMEGFDGIGKMLGLAAFGISKAAVSKAGWFDENFVPAYCEDNDYAYRCQLTGVPMVDIEGVEPKHIGSSVIYSDKNLFLENNRTYPNNVRYYREKWGGGIGTEETYTTPFNMGGSPKEWHLDISRLAELTWK